MTVQPLPASLDTAAAAPLRLALLDRIERHLPILLDGSDVVRVGQGCLQVLAAARANAAEDGLAWRIDAPSDALGQMASLAGLSALLDPLS